MKNRKAALFCSVSDLLTELKYVIWTYNNTDYTDTLDSDYKVETSPLTDGEQILTLRVSAAANTGDGEYTCVVTSAEDFTVERVVNLLVFGR